MSPLPTSLDTGIPSLHPHYRTSSLLRTPPTPRHASCSPRFLHLFRSGRQISDDRLSGSPWLLYELLLGSTRSKIPGVTFQARLTPVTLLPAGNVKPSAFPCYCVFGTPFLQGRLSTALLHLACSRTYASNAPLLKHLQGSIPGPPRAVTCVGSTPTSSYNLSSRTQPHFTFEMPSR